MLHPNFLPLREVRSSGWIENFLKTQASRLTGYPSIHGYPFGQKFWELPTTIPARTRYGGPMNKLPTGWMAR